MSAESRGGRAIWINGEPRPPDGCHVNAYDRGLTVADGVFETMRVVDGSVFRLDRHLARLRRALSTLAIPAIAALDEWVRHAACAATAEVMSVRLTVTRGFGPGGASPPPASEAARPTTIVALNPMPAFPSSIYEPGLVVHVAAGRRNEYAITAGLKTLAYTEAVVALIDAARAGANDALFLDTAGHCAEAASSNLFMWVRDELVTPPITCGVLPGITRATVLELARAQDLRCTERPFGLDELLIAEEAFLTSTLRGIAPIARLAGRPIGARSPGRITRDLSMAYERLVADECQRASSRVVVSCPFR